MFAIATGLIAKYTEAQTKSWAAAALTFLFLYAFWPAYSIGATFRIELTSS
jgi:hypothetical protein